MAIDRSEMKKLADLARLELTPDEAEALARDCRVILDYFDTIRRIDLSGATPMGALERGAASREDRVDRDALRWSPADSAPDWRDGYFVVPRLTAMDSSDAGDPGRA